VSASWTQKAGPKTKNVLQCLQFAKITIRQCKHGCKKRGKKKSKNRKGKDDRKLLKSNLTYLNLILCVPEWKEENWQSQGRCGYIHPPLSVQSLQENMDQ
jgi:hypothetical protein